MINLRVISVAVMVALGMLAAIQLASPESLGISPIAARWLGIVATGLGILQGVLPRVQGPTTDPDALADRIDAMTDKDRSTLRTILERRHGPAPAPTSVPASESPADHIIGLLDQSDPLPPNPRYPSGRRG